MISLDVKIIAHELGTKKMDQIIWVYILYCQMVHADLLYLILIITKKEQRLRTLQIRIMSGIKKWMRLEKCVSPYFYISIPLECLFSIQFQKEVHHEQHSVRAVSNKKENIRFISEVR